MKKMCQWSRKKKKTIFTFHQIVIWLVSLMRLPVSSLWVQEWERASRFRRESTKYVWRKPLVDLRKLSVILSFWIFPVSTTKHPPPPLLHQPVPSLLPMLYQDLWCMHALGLVWGEGRKGERDERGIGRGVKGRGVSWLFVLHCSHPCDQSREETFRALLQERHVVWFFKGEYNLKINLCALPQGWTHKTGLIKR